MGDADKVLMHIQARTVVHKHVHVSPPDGPAEQWGRAIKPRRERRVGYACYPTGATTGSPLRGPWAGCATGSQRREDSALGPPVRSTWRTTVGARTLIFLPH